MIGPWGHVLFMSPILANNHNLQLHSRDWAVPYDATLNFRTRLVSSSRNYRISRPPLTSWARNIPLVTLGTLIILRMLIQVPLSVMLGNAVNDRQTIPTTLPGPTCLGPLVHMYHSSTFNFKIVRDGKFQGRGYVCGVCRPWCFMVCQGEKCYDSIGRWNRSLWFSNMVFFEKRGKVESEISYSRPFFLKCTLMLMMLISLMQ